MCGTFERFYRKHGQPIDYDKASALCDEADQLIQDIQNNCTTLLYSEVEDKCNRLVQISKVLEKKYFIVRKQAF